MTIEYPLGVSGALTRVIEAGSGDRPVIFIHGLGARADRWQRNLEVFAQSGYRAIAIDLPGHGFASKTPDFDYSVPGFAEFVRGVIDALNLQSAAFVGTSLGGHISAYLACESPDRVTALALVGSLGLVPIGTETGAAIRDSVRATGRDDIENKLKFVICDHASITPEWIEEEWRINNSPGAADAFARLGDYIAGGVDEHTVGTRLTTAAGGTPLLLVWGAEDRAVPLSIGRQGRALLGDTRLCVIDGAGHVPYFEQAPTFNREVRSFLAGAGYVPFSSAMRRRV